ncbi:MAG: cell division regulator GpsB [Streptococcaceae bacterium]|nr:cell division regulator GpsB [Streptococcaceae bacterium]
MAEVNYTTQDILNKQFSMKMRGYDPEQVDEFLDNIIRDYEAYMHENFTLQEENARLQAKIANMVKVQQAVAPASSERKVKQNSAITNFDILKRLSNLEREVFGSKLVQEEKIKNVSEAQNQKAETFVEPEIDDQATRLI